MIPLSLQQIATVTGGRVHPPQARDVVVEAGVVTDSREVGPGFLYVARVGEHADGHQYLPQAAAAGAVAALTSSESPDLPSVVVPDTELAFAAIGREVVDRCQDAGGLQVIGITGSSGKTSTKDLMAQVVTGLGETIAPIASYNSEVGVPLTVCRLTASTQYLVAEMGASGIGHIDYLTKVAPPRIGVVLNVGTAHLGEFGSRQAIADTKAELVQALPPGADPAERDQLGHSTGGVAVLNADDPVVAAMAERTQARVVLVGTGPDVDVRARNLTLDQRGLASFDLILPGAKPTRVTLAVHGRHQVHNALAVAAVAAELGMDAGQIAAALAVAGPVSRWRMEVHDLPGGITLVNDAYNANPDSMGAALQALAAMRADQGRTIAVLGEMRELGDESDSAHRSIGRTAAALGIDVVVAVGSGAWPIAEEFRTQRPDATHVVEDAAAAATLLGGLLSDGDVVLLKSSRDSGLRHLGDDLVAAAAPAGGA